jgi:uncharacterized repeat protein (TIGR02543 family)
MTAWRFLAMALLAALASASLTLAGCEDIAGGIGGKPADITYAVTPDGGAAAPSTKIDFTFSAAVTGLKAEDITLAPDTAVAKETLSGGGTSWSLGITVQTAGNVKVSINKEGIESAEKPVTLSKGGTPPTPPTPPTQTQYTITFNADGGSPASQTRTVNHGGTAGTANMPTADRSGYTFGGWYTSTGGNGSQFTGSTTVNSNITVYAKWTASGGTPPTQYTITFNADGGSPASQTRTVNHGGTAGTANMPTAARSGYTFGGWYTSTGGNGSQFTGSTTVNSNITVYAKWTPITYTVKYHANGGIGTTDSSVHTYDVSKNLTANGFTRTGYTFAYWSIFDGSGTRYADGQSVKNLSNTQGATKTLYAQWTVNTFGQPITLTINDFIDHAGGVITEAPFTLSKSSSPSKPITVSGGGGTDITWYIGLAQIGTGSSITISATNLSVGPHTLRVTALYSGKQYSKEITFTVQQ